MSIGQNVIIPLNSLVLLNINVQVGDHINQVRTKSISSIPLWSRPVALSNTNRTEQLLSSILMTNDLGLRAQSVTLSKGTQG